MKRKFIQHINRTFKFHRCFKRYQLKIVLTLKKVEYKCTYYMLTFIYSRKWRAWECWKAWECCFFWMEFSKILSTKSSIHINVFWFVKVHFEQQSVIVRWHLFILHAEAKCLPNGDDCVPNVDWFACADIKIEIGDNIQFFRTSDELLKVPIKFVHVAIGIDVAIGSLNPFPFGYAHQPALGNVCQERRVTPHDHR